MKNEKLKENILYLKKELKKANKKADKHKFNFFKKVEINLKLGIHLKG
jgi:ribosomal protein L1